jgi:hypothetical protein
MQEEWGQVQSEHHSPLKSRKKEKTIQGSMCGAKLWHSGKRQLMYLAFVCLILWQRSITACFIFLPLLG